ncbi:MAG: alpha-glucuronidase family glycosyl hydrolase, partial [Acidobacteriota bacterium]|nr:alpha-glucuronidase family glycosyl hydrolase [Acidobacteriota bacterium]
LSHRVVEICFLLMLVGILNLPLKAVAPKNDTGMIASKGQAVSLIVVGNHASPSDRFVAGELQRYIEMLSGAKLAIITANEVGRQAKGLGLLLVGGPAGNELVGDAARRGQINFSGLKTQGYLLRRITVHGRPALVIGGNDEAGTMYAGYDFLERLGFVFLLTKDILPEKRAELALPSLDERVEPAFRRRGVNINNCYPNQTIWSLADWQRTIDQMAKMRMNYLQIFWFPNTPWLTYEYRGEKNFLGDASVKESGYMLWRESQGSFLVKDMTVGREHFKYPRIAPPELQDVQTPDQAFTKAQDLLRAVIAYAKTRKIDTWLAIDPVSVPPNLGRFARDRAGDLPFQKILGGAYMCPDDPVAHEINESRMRSLFSTYPGAQGYFLWFPELYPVCDDPQSRAYTLKERPKLFADETLHRKAYVNNYERDPNRVVDSDAGALELIRSAMEAGERLNPQAQVGIGAFGRGFVYPLLDKMFPKNVPFTDMISRAIWTPKGVPMGDYGGMGERERTVIARSDDDSSMLGMQFNVNMYYKDRTFEGALENGVTGHAMQVNRARGMEHNERFLAEGGWKPHLTPGEFYSSYTRRIFGEAAAPEALKAYQILEENEEYLGWTGRANFPCCGVAPEISIIRTYADQGNPYDGPTFTGWAGFLVHARKLPSFYAHSAGLLRQAASHLDQAEKVAAPGSRAELDYLRNKTEAYAMHLDTMVLLDQAYLEFDAAFQLRLEHPAEFVQKLDHSLEMFREAHRMSIAMATKFSEIIDDPSDLGVLYRINVYMIDGTDCVLKFMQNIDDFHHGKPYLNPVPFEKVFMDWPRVKHGRL